MYNYTILIIMFNTIDLILQIIFRTSVDHPHHSLYVTLALSHASMDDAFPASGHVTGVAKATRPTGRLAKKTSTAGSTVDEV